MAAWIHNTRVSPKLRAIPWCLTYSKPPRTDLFPFQIVNVINGTKITTSKASARIFVGLRSPTEAIVWNPRTRGIVETVHPSQIRTIRPSIDFILSHFGADEDTLLERLSSLRQEYHRLGALAASSNRLPPRFRSLPEWKVAVKEHAEKLLGMAPAPLEKLTGPLPPGATVDVSFFTGQERDGQIKARLVVNRGEMGCDDDVVTNDLPPMHERLALLSVMEYLRTSDPRLVVRAGDVSGAYYATKAEGYLKLPNEWPTGVGGMTAGEVVRSNCAMPGSRLGSGLFLTQLDSQLVAFPRTYGTIRKGRDFIGCNYSDDLLGIGSPEAWTLLNEQISQQYAVQYEEGYPARWVGMDFTFNDGILNVGCSSTCLKYEIVNTKLPTREEFAALKPEEKSDDEHAKRNAKVWVGRLMYLATLHPALCYSATFLSSAMHYIPEESALMAERLINAAMVFKPTFQIRPIQPKFCVIYVDASQDLPSCRATVGVLMQLQESEVPEPLHNPIFWVTKRIASLYNSSYTAESKGLSEACVYLAEHRNFIKQLWPNIEFVMFNDNKALCETITNRGKAHPFASTIIDFVREKLNEFACRIEWIRTHDNLADQLTKFKRFW